METKCNDSGKNEKEPEKWRPPTLTIFGDMRILTQNIGTEGTGDASYEGKSCKSPGNCA